MPLNKLENFIKNTDGRTLYVNPADLNATDSISNEGTSLTEPFRTVQRALLEAARFSYVRGDDNDLIEKTTILLYPGEHTIDNRPGYAIKENEVGAAVAISPTGEEVSPSSVFDLLNDSNFDIESPDNILWHFNSVYGGVVVPRGTSIVGMDLRKTKIRPKYVPNPTDPAADNSAIFRITGTCYFWQFTIFDGAENGYVFTDPTDFSENNRSTPTFSHHKLTAFEYADGVNVITSNDINLTDLQIYYSKLSNAYNLASGRNIVDKFPEKPEGFAPQRPEFEIVGAFATDPVRIASLIAGDGFTPDAVVTVDTVVPHGLSAGTPIKIRGVAISDYNISTKVATVITESRFTYTLSFVRPELPARPSVSSATVTVETDTVTGASPYIFNVSMRSVWGINGMHADGSKATGFRSMVVAQFTAISLQKDDRAFVKYNEQARRYDGINVSSPVRGAELSALSSSTNSATVYHLDPQAIYRPEWGTTHIKMTNDAVIQIVSVFAIGFNQHFFAGTGADASITNSNSNFGQFALLSDGFKNNAFTKDDKGFISQVITPKNAFNPNNDRISNVGYVNLDFDLTRSQALPGQLYLLGYTNKEETPPFINQGFRLGANYEEELFQPLADGSEVSASIRMTNNIINGSNNVAVGDDLARKVYPVVAGPGQGPTSGSTLTLPAHGLLNGETIRIFSGNGDLPENIEAGTLYYANVVDFENIRISTSQSNALNDIFLDIYGGTDLRIESRVNDKTPGLPGHPIQYDDVVGNWFIHTNTASGIYAHIINNPTSTEGFDFVTLYRRKSDNRSLDDKIYRLRYVVPKESVNAKPPTAGYVIQESSTTGARNNDDFIQSDITFQDYEYNRNPRFIVNCAFISLSSEVEVRSELPHQLSVGDKVNIINVTSTGQPDAVDGRGYNGEFIVTRIMDARTFRYSSTDVQGVTRNLLGEFFTNDTNDRNILLPRFQRKNNQANVFVYRVEEISSFSEGVRDGIYHLYCVNGSNAVTETFTDREYNQPIEDFYPQLDTDNIDSNPPASSSFADRAPLGKVVIDSKQTSITRETLDKLTVSQNRAVISAVTAAGPNLAIEFDREHSFNGLYGYSSLQGGSGYIDGVYYNVKLLSAGNEWKGGSAKVTIISGAVNSLVITDPGSGYIPGEELELDPTTLGGGSGGRFTVGSSDIENSVGVLLQFSGGGLTTPDSYAQIVSVDSQTQIQVPAASVSSLVLGMYAQATDTVTPITSYSYTDGSSTFEADPNTGFGFQRGNSFVAFDASGNDLGKFYAGDLPAPATLQATTDLDLTGVSYIGKCGYEDNDAPTGSTGENIGVRGTSSFDLGVFWLVSQSGTGNTLEVAARDGGVNGRVLEKLPLGRYLQLGSEIVRVSSTTFSGPSLNTVSVIRGALGTNVIDHPAGTKVRAINPLPIELRRPSILRASGHTFEYLGYGPGNYSTSLPQLQVRQLPDEEVYLVQAQELACGQVVYTGMSDNGDFYIGNTKYSATSGTQITFDVPIPTVAGQDASSNNVVFDEVIVNRRIFVAGGDNNQVLSQFDGPVKFTQSVNFEADINATGNSTFNTVEILSTQNASSPANGGALTVRGGVGIGSDLYVGGTLYTDGDLSTNVILARDPDLKISLFENQGDGELGIGSGTASGKVVFNTTILGTGEGGEDGIATSDGGVDIKGSLVVRDKIIAKEFVGDGLGKPGSIIMWGGNSIEDNEITPGSIPKGFLLCDGRSLNRNTYSKLFAAIGYTHGGSGNNFRLPDLRERFIVGAGGNSNSVSGTSGYLDAATGGSNFVTLTEDELASHTHNAQTVNLNHTHGFELQADQANAPHTHGGDTVTGGGHRHAGRTVDNNESRHTHSGGTITGGSHNHGYAAPEQAGYEVGGGQEEAANLGTDGRETENASHTHSGSDIEIGNGGSEHNHTIQILNNGTDGQGNSYNSAHSHEFTTNNANARHSHNVIGDIETAQLNGTPTLDPTGGGESHENRPPFYALSYIIQYK